MDYFDPHKHEHKAITDTCITLNAGWAWHATVYIEGIQFSFIVIEQFGLQLRLWAIVLTIAELASIADQTKIMGLYFLNQTILVVILEAIWELLCV